ncbi:MAG: hypothetical protein ACKPEY_12135, partial [Planctomycetota bacterium]
MIDPPLTLDKDLPVDLPTSPLGLLLSGGLDSAILQAVLLEEGRTVFPIFIRGGLLWENEERR